MTATEPSELKEALFDDVEPEQPKKKRGRKAPTSERRERTEQLVACYREHAPSLVPVHSITDKRITSANAALDRVPSIAQWAEFFKRCEASSYLRGSKGWKADFEWCLKPDTWPKVFEGKYDDRTPTGPAKVIKTAADARAAVRERGLEHVTKDTEIDLR